MVHLNGEGESPAVAEGDFAAPGAGAATDVGVNVRRFDSGDAEIHRPPAERELFKDRGPLLGAAVRSGRRDFAVDVVAQGLGDLESSLGGGKGQGFGLFCFGRQETRQGSGEIVAEEVLGTHPVVGLELGRTRPQPAPGEHDVPFIHPQVGPAPRLG